MGKKKAAGSKPASRPGSVSSGSARSDASGADGSASPSSSSSSSTPAPPPPPPVGPPATDRFSAGLAALSSNADDMWVDLSGCGIGDGKGRRVAAAIAACSSSATSIDLSSNALTDAGAAALAAALASGGAPDLVALDLRGNPGIGPAGAAALADAVDGRPAVSIALDEAAAGGARAPGAGADGGGGGGGGGGANEAGVAWAGGMGAGAGPAGLGLPPAPDPAAAAAALDAARKALTPPKKVAGGGGGAWAPPPARIAALASALSDLLAAVQAEVTRAVGPVFGDSPLAPRPPSPPPAAAAAPPFPPSTKLEDLPPCLRAAAERAPATLAKALDAPPAAPPDAGRDSTLPCGLPVPAVGGHRVVAARLAAALLGLRLPSVDARLAAAGVLPRVLNLATAHGHCSPLHAAALACLAAALASGCARLWAPLFEGGGGSAALPAALAGVLTGGDPVSRLPGARPPAVGWAVAAAGLLEGAAAAAGDGDDPPPPPPTMPPPPKPSPAAATATAAALAGCPAWQAVARPGGPLRSLVEEQAGGDLGAPRPPRTGLAGSGGGGGGGEEPTEAQRAAARAELLRLLSQMRVASG